MTEIHPALIFILGAFLIPLLNGKIKKFYLLFIPVFVFIQILYLKDGDILTYNFLNYDLILLKVNKLNLCFGYAFAIISFAGFVYALNIKNTWQHFFTFLHIGSAFGIIFAGDLFTLFIFWEIQAISGAFVIISQQTKRSISAGLRYIVIHLLGGICLFSGIVIHFVNTSSFVFEKLNYLNVSSSLILVAFLINAAVPPFSTWLSDAYPEASPTGSVFLSAFTTKGAVYTLVVGFAGENILMWLGGIMAVYGVVFAVLENDMRRLLSYHIISQVGYMVCGVGLGSELSINGSVAHAFCHILYKALLLMGVGSIIYATGKNKLSQLQGNNLYRTMPLTLMFYIIGALSISGFPLFSGFISKSIITFSAENMQKSLIYLMLTLASIGTFLSVNLKLPYLAFGGANKNKEKITGKEVPFNMLFGMGVLAFLCIFIGCYPQVIYSILPYPVNYKPYTIHHVISTLALFSWTGIAFKLFTEKLKGEETITLDIDWFYRKGWIYFTLFCRNTLNKIENKIQEMFSSCISYISRLLISYSEDTWKKPIGLSILFAILLLFFYILVEVM